MEHRAEMEVEAHGRIDQRAHQLVLAQSLNHTGSKNKLTLRLHACLADRGI
jgi:hypothetical protein